MSKMSNAASHVASQIANAPQHREIFLSSSTPEVRAEVEAELRRVAPLSEADVAELAALNAAQSACSYAASSSSRKSWITIMLVAGVEPELDTVKYERVFDGALKFESLPAVTFAGGQGCALGAQDVTLTARIVKRGSTAPSKSLLTSARADVIGEAKAAKLAAASDNAAVIAALAKRRADVAAAIAAFEAAGA